jgi:hypothetical protein
MEIVVQSIEPGIDNNNDKMIVRVDFSDEAADGLTSSASVIVWIPKRDAPLSELTKEARQAAIAFLRDAATARSD